MGRWSVAVAVGLSLGAVAALAPPAGAALRAGAASADLTPPVGTPMFAYTARSRIANPENLPTALQLVSDPGSGLYAKSFVASEGIHTRVKARALVLERSGELFALAQADLGGIPYAMTQEVLRRVRGSGITGERLLLSATHTHSSTGPIWPLDNLGYGLLGGDLFDLRTFDLTAQGIAEALLRARANLVRARVGVGTAELRGASRNRAFEPFERNKDVPKDAADRRAASIDPTVTVVRADDLEGRPIAVWTNFAMHPTSFGEDNLLFSGDNVATAERLVEEELAAAGGRDPVAVWTNGAEGDVSPDGDPRRRGDQVLEFARTNAAKAHLAGVRSADGLVRAWRDAGGRLRDDLRLEARRTFLPFDGTAASGSPVGPVPALGMGIVAEGVCSPVPDLAGPGQGEKLPLIAAPGLAPSVVPVSLWRVGDQGIVSLPVEMTKQMGERVRRGLLRAADGGLDRVAIAGLTNGYVSYTSTPEEYEACAYEGSFTLFGKQQGARLLDGARALVRPLLANRRAPAGAAEPVPLGLPLGVRLPAQPTPEAGTVVAEPAERAVRGERVTFAWRGGHPSLDAPRGGTLVHVERRAGDGWETVTTDDGPLDTTQLEEGTWTETLQLDHCSPTGTYRFRVSGVADRGSGGTPYTVVSRTFEVGALKLQAAPATVSRSGVVSVAAEYPDPGPEALVSMPRAVVTGRARVRVLRRGGRRARTVVARPKEAKRSLEVRVPRGSKVRLLGVRDACGNTT
jgi:neutral ceramidase